MLIFRGMKITPTAPSQSINMGQFLQESDSRLFIIGPVHLLLAAKLNEQEMAGINGIAGAKKRPVEGLKREKGVN
jgi:hypothetical protein